LEPPAQFESQAKKRRRERGKTHRGAQKRTPGKRFAIQALHA
jgi:hypothetical protein